MQETKTPITDVRTVGVPVSDQDRALAFHLDKLGFEKRLDAPVEQPAPLRSARAKHSTRRRLPRSSEQVIANNRAGGWRKLKGERRGE